jgi:hypothetical protein
VSLPTFRSLDVRQIFVVRQAGTFFPFSIVGGEPYFLLTKDILRVIQESGANEKEAFCALDAARAFLPMLRLQIEPTLTIHT